MELAIKDINIPDNIDELKARAAAEVKHNFKSSTSDRVYTKDKCFTLPDGSDRGATLEVLILSMLYNNSYYEGRYDPQNPQAPLCFASGKNEKILKPAADIEKPKSTTCDVCDLNQWGSDGRGKACKNTIKLICLVSGYEEPVSIHIPPTGIKDFKKELTSIMGEYEFITDVTVTLGFKSDVAFSVPVIMKAEPSEDPKAAFAMSLAVENKLALDKQ